MKNSKKLICLQENDDCREMLRVLLEIEGYNVKTCGTSEEILSLLGQSDFSAIILDYYLPGINGVEICRKIRNQNLKTPIIFYSAAALPTDRNAGLEAGAQAYLVKPSDLEKLTKILARLVAEQVV